jgi:hypothetical protein
LFTAASIPKLFFSKYINKHHLTAPEVVQSHSLLADHMKKTSILKSIASVLISNMFNCFVLAFADELDH